MIFILDQLARSGLLPKSESTAILSGNNPSLSALIPHLLIGSVDANALTACDQTATWTQLRISRQLLGLTFIAALLLDQSLGLE
jgi:hypothetical protein